MYHAIFHFILFKNIFFFFFGSATAGKIMRISLFVCVPWMPVVHIATRCLAACFLLHGIRTQRF